MADNEYGLANNFASQYGSNTSLKQYEDLLTGKLPGANVQTVTYNGSTYGMDPKSMKLMQIGPTVEAAKGIPDSTTDTSKDLLGMNPDQWGSALKMGQIGVGVGNLGLGLASYFQNKGLAKKQKELLGQQIESNRAEIDARKNYRSALEGFGLQSQPTRI